MQTPELLLAQLSQALRDCVAHRARWTCRKSMPSYSPSCAA
jgi:hypothetical protein